MLKVGMVLYTMAGNYTEIIKIEEEGDYPVVAEVTTGQETNLVNYTLDGRYLLDKKTTMDLDLNELQTSAESV